MIKTTEVVSYDTVDLDKKEYVFARITSTNRNDDKEIYTLFIEEWVNLPYIIKIPNQDGVLVDQEIINKKVIRNTTRIMSFAQADGLTSILDGMFTIESTGCARRKEYTILGHLIVNNQENVRNTSWELVTQ